MNCQHPEPILYPHPERIGYFVVCPDCGIETEAYSTKESAIAAWKAEKTIKGPWRERDCYMHGETLC